MIYLGVGVGSFVQSWADEYGRLEFIKWNAILQTIFGLLSCMATNINWFIGFRFAYGIGIGIVLPISGTYISEISPTEFRAMLVAKSRIYWSLGCLFTFLFGWYLLKLHYWRLLLLVICVPGIYALI
jgi:putative MFS transporter